MEKNRNIRDPSNLTYTTKLSKLFDNSGNVRSFQKEKYDPIIDFLLHCFNNKKNVNNINLLDVGIGYGAFLKICEQKKNFNLFGMDPFPESINIAKRFTKADIRDGRIEKLPWPFKTKQFDIITCIDVVEHLQNPEIFFKNVTKYISKDGIIVVRTPNKDLPYSFRKIPLIGVKDVNPTHVSVHNSRYWKQLAQKNEFKVIKDWKGEHLWHIKLIYPLNKITKILRVDHRNVPILNKFEQAYIMVLKLQK